MLNQRLLNENLPKPKLNILIYPWLQMFSLLSPSMIYNRDKGLTSIVKFGKVQLWYIGYSNENLTKEMENAIENDHHTLLLDELDRKKFKSYTDFSIIPNIYKNKSYYRDENILKLISIMPSKLDETSVLKREKKFAEKVKLFFREDISPGKQLIINYRPSIIP